MPARREIWAGVQEFWWRFWGPLEPWDQPIAHLARQSGRPIATHHVQQGLAFGMGQRERRPHVFPAIEAGQFIPGVEMPVWRVPLPVDYANEQPLALGDLLFHNPTDPAQAHSLTTERPDVVKWLEGLLREQAQTVGAPDEQIRRLRL